MTISIRRLEPGDYEAMHQIFVGPKVVWGMLQLPYPALETWRRALAEPRETSFRLVGCVDGQVVGQVDIHTAPNRPRRQHVGEIGIAVRDDYQGRGLGTVLMQAAMEVADKWLNLLRLELEVYADNAPAVRLYQKFGFVVEGTLVRSAYRAGEYVDVYTMARLRQE